jgi:membrane protease YdiL (CAAX protease family)
MDKNGKCKTKILGRSIAAALLRISSNPAIIFLLPHSLWQQREVSTLEYITDFLLAVMAGVVSAYIYKWFDNQQKGQ